MNEPHAPIYIDGQYHLFYQHNPAGPYFHHLHWGYWVSDDLVHWRELPVALSPDHDAIDLDGSWSGSATHDADGSPALLFTVGTFSKTPNQAVGLARPSNPVQEDPDVVEWSKHDDLIIEKPSNVDLRTHDFRDPRHCLVKEFSNRLAVQRLFDRCRTRRVSTSLSSY
jgi:sucrose-6-phosphate hydrolase SacC (GH32 family)